MTPGRAREQPARLDPAVLAAIADLEFVARVTVDGTVAGLHRSPFHGYSAEFSQYRQYRPGDDLKYVDWKLFARTDRVYTKQYRETTNLMASIAIDTSASMGYGGAAGVAKIDYARVLAAALSHVLSRQGDAVGLVTFDDDVRQYVPARTGPLHARGILLALSKLAARGVSGAAAPLRRAVDLMRRRGLLVLISDLYDEDPRVESELRRAVRMGHEVALFHLLAREEISFPFDAPVELEDVETGATALAGGSGGEAYRQAFSAFLRRWEERCTANGIDYTRVVTDAPLDQALRKYLLKRPRGTTR